MRDALKRRKKTPGSVRRRHEKNGRISPLRGIVNLAAIFQQAKKILEAKRNLEAKRILEAKRSLVLEA